MPLLHEPKTVFQAFQRDTRLQAHLRIELFHHARPECIESVERDAALLYAELGFIAQAG